VLALLALILSPDFSESDAGVRLPKPVRPQLAIEEKCAADGPFHLLAEEHFVRRPPAESRVRPAGVVEEEEVATHGLEVATREQHGRVPAQHFLESAEQPLDAAIRPGMCGPSANVPHPMSAKEFTEFICNELPAVVGLQKLGRAELKKQPLQHRSRAPRRREAGFERQKPAAVEIDDAEQPDGDDAQNPDEREIDGPTLQLPVHADATRRFLRGLEFDEQVSAPREDGATVLCESETPETRMSNCASARAPRCGTSTCSRQTASSTSGGVLRRP
jgi:hypothetical protein